METQTNSHTVEDAVSLSFSDEPRADRTDIVFQTIEERKRLDQMIEQQKAKVLALQTKATNELLERYETLSEDFKALGIPMPSQSGDAGLHRAAPLETPKGLCPVCRVAGHDLRLKAHRDQGKKKKVLTSEQLEGVKR